MNNYTGFDKNRDFLNSNFKVVNIFELDLLEPEGKPVG